MPAFTKRVSDGIAWLELNAADESVNKITRAVREELRELLESLCVDDEVKAAILISRKPDQFIAGADVREFADLTSRREALKLVRDGQQLVNRFETIGKPIVAAIHGACVGGGLEAVLACSYRIATNSAKTMLGLPEVRLGLIPAAGGCQRLPRLIGVRQALKMILTGRLLSSQEAFHRGLVDELVHPSILDAVALRFAKRFANGWKPNRRRGKLARTAVDLNPLSRKVILSRARKTLLEKSAGNYPAPLGALETVGHGLQYGLAAGLEHEAAHFSELAVGEVSKNLVQLFFAEKALKKDHGVAGTGAAPRPVTNLAIVGAGFMGSAIAGEAVARAVVDVRLKEADLDRVVEGLDRARSHLRDRLRRCRITKYEHRRLDALLSGGIDWAGFLRADLVVEAVPENLELKHQVLGDLERNVGPECVIASNTITIPISEISKVAQEPQRIVGMHFFSPVAKIPLVEVIPHAHTAPWVVATAVSFAKALNKTVIVVKDGPGFWVNRILAPYLREAWLLLESGVDPQALDRAMTEFGFPVGPVTLLDEIGLDVVLEAAHALSHAFGERMKPLDGLSRMVDAGRLGRKSGHGLFHYRKGKRKRFDAGAFDLICMSAPSTVPDDDITRRLVYLMLNEAALALHEGVVRSPRDGDVGAVFGLGFPPFTGGPLRYLDSIGAVEALATLEELTDRYGERFKPAPSLIQMADRNARFYQERSSTEH